jgi:hypothetical protein
MERIPRQLPHQLEDKSGGKEGHRLWIREITKLFDYENVSRDNIISYHIIVANTSDSHT